MKSKLGFALMVIVSVLVLTTVISSGELVSAATQGDEQKTVEELLQDYEDALQYELENGDTQEIEDPENGVQKILVGESQEKMNQLWAETLEKINALQYRPEEERSEAIAAINQVTDESVEFIDHSRTPYNPSAEIEDYESGGYVFQVDVASEKIIKMWIKDQQNFSVDAKCTQDDLVKLAQDHVARLATEVKLDVLSLSIQDKSSEVYFYRWEAPTRRTADGTTAFIQVALSRAGDLLNYENTIPLSIKEQSNVLDSIFSIPTVFAIGANEYYSNGGSRWYWEVSTSYSQEDNAGYCFTQGYWCTPKHYYYANSPSRDNTYYGTGDRGKWVATSYMRNRSTKTAAYIPCDNATAYVFYFNWYNGGASYYDAGVNQQIWCNTWATSSSTLYDIQRVVLANTSETCCNKKIAWDEIWDYVL